MMNKVRRIVTGFNDDGKSIILIDADATNHIDAPGPDLRITDIWVTETIPADNTGFEDMGEREPARTLESGTIFRYVEFDPGHGVDEPLWHATDTVDYVVIVKGELYCMMDEGEVLLKAGDLLVQRGTNHAWVNRSNESCVMVGVMISAIPLS